MAKSVGGYKKVNHTLSLYSSIKTCLSAGNIAKIKLIQSIGRGVRLHENKNKLFIFDIADNLLYGAKHLRRRKEIYEEEGFKTTTKGFEE